MKPYLPYNILLALALVVTGLFAFYNFAYRESYATTIRYEYPEVQYVEPQKSKPSESRQSRLEETAPEQEREVALEDEPAPVPDVHTEEESGPLLSVQFPLDINTATVEQLKFIPQVGDVLAQRIVQYRAVLDGYTDLEQLRDIKNVGDKTLVRLETYLYIANETTQSESSVAREESVEP